MPPTPKNDPGLRGLEEAVGCGGGPVLGPQNPVQGCWAVSASWGRYGGAVVGPPKFQPGMLGAARPLGCPREAPLPDPGSFPIIF